MTLCIGGLRKKKILDSKSYYIQTNETFAFYIVVSYVVNLYSSCLISVHTQLLLSIK